MSLPRLARHNLVQNALSMYWLQMSSYVVPIVLIPYLARVLGAAGWGLVAFAQALGGYVGMVVEFGFFLSANREIARCRDDRNKRGEILAGVLGARIVLCIACIALAQLARLWIPVYREQPILFWGAMFWGVTQGFSMSWYFQGLERMGLIAALETPSQIAGLIALFIFVHRPEQAWLVLVIQGVAYAVPAAIELALAYAEVPFMLPSWRSMRQVLAVGWNMFLYRGSLEGYTRANTLILGLFVSPQLVGYYAAAEKISRASYRCLNPITLALFPRMSYLVHHARERANKLARVGVLVVVAGGVLLSIFLFVAAPWIVSIVLGHGFGPTVSLLRILSAIPALVSVWQAYGTQWMLPLGLDRPFTNIMIIAAVINIGLALVIVPKFGSTGMAWTAIVAESVLAVGYYGVIRVRRLDPLSSATMQESVVASSTT